MANPEHLAILKKGVEAWNKWRKENPDVVPDLFRATLSGGSLSGANLSGANLNAANLTKAELANANLANASLMMVILTEADLSNADLTNAKLVNANLVSANLTQANLIHARLTQANLSWADLSGAVLIGTDLIQADLLKANLGEARLNGARLFMANLNFASLSGADLSGAGFFSTIIANLDLSEARGLESVQHAGPSILGFDVLLHSNREIPTVFLRGAGVPEEFIKAQASAAHRPSKFYSCFISYSTKDRDFATRLYADLQAKGVLVFIDSEDLPIGAKLRPTFDEAIRKHDKLLLLLSEHSVQSDWVEKEVETAFERERTEERLVLFPVRLDDAVMAVPSGWAADIRRARNIGDFRQWKEHEAYKKAFERLLRDLKASPSPPPPS